MTLFIQRVRAGSLHAGGLRTQRAMDINDLARLVTAMPVRQLTMADYLVELHGIAAR